MITVDVDMDRCQGYRLCCLAVPEVFTLGEGKVRYSPEAAEHLLPRLEEVGARCPTNSITMRVMT